MHREARHRTFGQRLQHTFFYRGHEHAWNRAALDHIDKLKTRTTGQRFNTQHDFAKLASATALLFVSAMAFGVASDGLNIGNLWSTGG